MFTFESFIKKCPKETSTYIEKILELSITLMTYDPNYSYDESGDIKMQDDEDEGGWGSAFEDEHAANDDDDDTSWKVRRAAIKVLEAIIQSRPE
jgi:cullin-associated NEDD8-dissociated protein 1